MTMSNISRKPAAFCSVQPIWLLWLAASLFTASWLSVSRAQSRTSQVSTNQARAITLVKTAEAAFLRGDYNRTLVLCRQASAANPRYARAYTWMGAAYEKLGQTAQARQAYQRVLSLGSASQDAAYVRTRLNRLPAPPVVAASGQNGQRTAALPTATTPLPPPALPLPASSPTPAPPGRPSLPTISPPVVAPAPAVSLPPAVRPAPPVTRVPDPAPVQTEPDLPAEEPGIDPRNDPQAGNMPNESVNVGVSEAGSSADIEGFPIDGPPRVVEASRLLGSGQLNALRRVKVQNRQYSGGIYRISNQDHDVTFYLNREWEWFEARVAIADNATTNTGGLWGWFNGQPSRRAFHYPKVQKGQAPIVVRIRVADATHLTLAPTYPGNPIVLMEPRFIRRRTR